MTRIELDFPLCAEEASDAAARPAVLEAVRFLEEEAGSTSLEAVILTGSFARGEGSILLTNPHHRILGDIEFLVIARPPFDYPALRRDMRRLGNLATRRLRQLGYQAAIEYSPAGRSYLERSVRPSIFAFDLLSHGKTVAGDPGLLEAVPRFAAAAIPREDAVRLVMNRMMEIHSLRLGSSVDPLERAYFATKTFLDLAGSVLAFEGCYVSRYADRLESARRLVGSRRFSSEIVTELERAVEGKLYPREEHFVERAPDLDRALDRAMELWRWEMGKLVGGGDTREILDAFLASEDVWQTIRGWAKYYTHPLRPESDRASPWRSFRLFFRASPQRLVYASALLAHQAERSGNGYRQDAARLLPSASGDSPLASAVELWSWLVRNN